MKKRHQISRIVAILLLITGINATFAGLAFILSPNGRLLGISKSVLQYSPFPDFLIPGIVLLIVNGICNVAVAVLTIHRKRYYSTLVSFQGIILVGWLILQVYFLREINALQLSMFLIGILLILIGILINSEQSLKF